jgi:hypothetical protein
MVVRLGFALAVLVVGLSPARAQDAAKADAEDLEKVNRDCKFLMTSPAAGSKAKGQARQWLEATKSRAWGATTGRYVGMGRDEGGWFVRLQPEQGDAVTVHYKGLDADAQKRMKDLWDLRYYIPQWADKLRAELAEHKDAAKEVHGDTALLVNAIRAYITRIGEINKAGGTVVQIDAANAAAVEELKARVGKCGPVVFTARVAEVLQQGPRFDGKPRERWWVSMDVPRELDPLVRAGVCGFHADVWVKLDQAQGLSIHKGDQITLRGPVPFTEHRAHEFSGGPDVCAEVIVSSGVYYNDGRINLSPWVIVPISPRCLMLGRAARTAPRC